MHIELFDARVLAPLVGFLDENGSHSGSFLSRAAIPVELVEEGGWVTKKQAYDFTYDIVQRSRCQEAVFAAYLGFEHKHLGPIADAMKLCKTVKESLEVAARLGNIAYEGSEYFLYTDGDTTWFCYREPYVVSAGQQFISDMTLAVFYHLIQITVNENWRPERMLTRGQLIDRHRMVDVFQDCRASYHPHFSGLAFPTEFLSRRLPWKDQAAEFDVNEAWQFGPNGSEPIVEKLYRLVASRFRYRKLPTLDQVAEMAGISPATLKRHLRLSGLSYTGLLDRVRFDSACELLSMPQMTLNEIAHELGYSGTNNFVRSFRRMTGVTPGQYRRKQSLSDGRR